MSGSVSYQEAAFGKDENNKNVVIPMNRLSTILYFHLTSDLDEAITSATLTVEGGDIAATTAKIDNGALVAVDGGSNTITLTFAEGTAPSAKEFQLWFNCLPVTATGLELTVTTASKTATLKNTKGKTYAAGKLNKIVKSGLTWNDNVTERFYEEVKSNDDISDGNYLIVYKDTESAYVLTGVSDKNIGTYAEVTITEDGISEKDFGQYNIVAEEVSDGQYTLKLGDIYLAYTSTATSKNNNLWGVSDAAANGTLWTLECDGITSVYNTGRKLQFNTKSGNERFCGYTGGQGDVTLFKISGTGKTALNAPANLKVENKVVSWDAVDNAATYDLTIGEQKFSGLTSTSYDASSITDEYYDVAVVAKPTQGSETYKASAPASLSNVQFGTPSLNTPTLAVSAFDENTITISWTNDARATQGYTASIYQGETKLDKDQTNVTSGSVKFTDLTDNTAYTIKVKANAVTGEKAYAESAEASIDASTKAATHVSDITAEGTYTVKNLLVYKKISTSNAIVGDGTGFILLYKSSHGLNDGDTFTASGTVSKYNGVWELNQPTISDNTSGATVEYGDAEDFTAEKISTYESNPSIKYIHVIGKQDGRYISVGSGSKQLYLNPANAGTDGKDVEIFGFIYGYSSSNSNSSLACVSIDEYVDESISTLVTSPANGETISWNDDESGVDKKQTITVTLNKLATGYGVSYNDVNSEWSVTDNEDGTITVYPKEANTSETDDKTLEVTITHKDDASKKSVITLKQSHKGGGGYYQIVFGNNVKSATALTASTKASTVISAGTDYVAASPFAVTGNVYYGDTQTCIRLGKSGAESTLTITLSEAGKVKAKSIVVHCNNPGNNKNSDVKLNVNSLGEQTTTKTEADYTFTFDSATQIESIIMAADKSLYVYSITVNY